MNRLSVGHEADMSWRKYKRRVCSYNIGGLSQNIEQLNNFKYRN